MSKKILELCLSPDLGGLELFMLSCYHHFKTKNDTYICIARGSKIDNYLVDENKLYIKRNKLLPFLPALHLARFIDNNDIDTIHFHWNKDIITAVLAKILSKKKPKLIQTRNMTMTRFKDDFYHRWIYSHLDTVHAVTYQVKNQLEKFIPKEIRPKVEVIYMGTKAKKIDTKRVKELQKKYNLSNSFTVGIVGRIEDGKGQFLVIEALKELKDLNIKLLIVGHTMNEDYLISLKKKVKKYILEDKVIFTGFTKEVDEHMSLFDINILATKQETFGLVVIEAMVNKVTMLATNKGGPLEIIEDGVDGLLFERNAKDLATKIKLLYHDKKLTKKLSTNGYNKAIKEFDLDTQLKKLYGVICEG